MTSSVASVKRIRSPEKKKRLYLLHGGSRHTFFHFVLPFVKQVLLVQTTSVLLVIADDAHVHLFFNHYQQLHATSSCEVKERSGWYCS